MWRYNVQRMMICLLSMCMIESISAGEKAVMDAQENKEYAIKVKGIEFRVDGTEMVFFRDENSCTTGKSPEESDFFIQSFIEERRVVPNTWAKVILKGQDLTNCQKGLREGNYVVFNFKAFSQNSTQEQQTTHSSFPTGDRESSKKYKVKVKGYQLSGKEKIVVFVDEGSCQTITNQEEAYTWRPIFSIAELEIPSSSWVKMMNSNKNITPCKQGEIEGDRLVFNFTLIKTNQKIILLENLKSFHSAGRSNAIRDSLLEMFFVLKDEGFKEALSLITMEGDGALRTVITAEELSSLPKESTTGESILGKIQGKLTFSEDAVGFNCLKNLSFVDTQYKNIDRIVYFTSTSSEPKNSNELFGDDVGTVLLWKSRKVKMLVITDNNCDLWEKAELQIPCYALQSDPSADKIEKLVMDFLLNKN